VNIICKSESEYRAWVKEVEAARFLGFQKRWIADRSRNKIAEKSRQIGFSWSDAFDTVTETAMTTWPYDCWVTSRDQIQAQLYGTDCQYWAGALQIAAGAWGEVVVNEEKKISAQRMPLANERNIWSLSSNVDAQAGKRGTRKLDEFALNPRNRALFSIAQPGTTWGGRLVIFSTHRGTANYHNELIQEIRHKGNPKNFSLHRVTLEDALREGLLIKLKQRWRSIDPGDDRLKLTEDEYLQQVRNECADEETFKQEYMCEPDDDGSAFISYELIDSCKYRGEEKWQTDLAETKNPLFIGVDIGRKHDLTVIWVIEKVGGVNLTRRVIELKKTRFAVQESILYPLLDLPNLSRCCIDDTGIGAQFAERAKERPSSAGKVEAVTFTPRVKSDLAHPTKASFEDRSVRIPDEKEIIADLRGIRKETTSSNNVRFTGERSESGHCDRFWALALALHAGKTPTSNYWGHLIS